MKRLFLIAVVIAVFAAFFASTHPDGLDFVAQKLGFSNLAAEGTAPMANYSIPGIFQGWLSTFLAGFSGILIVFGLFYLIAFIYKKALSALVALFAFCALIALNALFFSSPVFAARPLVTDDFYTVPNGGYELEVGYAATQNQDLSSANTAGLSFKRGFASNFDLGIEIPYTFTDPSGLNDLLLHAKYCFWKPDEDAGLTARIDYKFRNGEVNRGLGSGEEDYWLMLIGSKMFGDTKTHINIGFVNVGYNMGDPNNDYWAYSFALEHPAFGEKGDIVAEYVGNSAINPHPGFIQLGGRYALTETFKVDAAYAFGLNDNSIKNSATAGIHWEF